MSKVEVLQVLCPYGKWAHKNGMQTVDEKSAQDLLKNFSSVLAGSFWSGAPVYIGHPDDPENFDARARAVGRIKKLYLAEGGIAALVSYPTRVFEKLKSGEIKAMSPRWQMKRNSDGSYSPIKLISAGLTNNPNIPGSGKIISLSALSQKNENEKAMARAKSAAVKIVNELAKISEGARVCGTRATSFNEKLRSQNLKMRISQLPKDANDESKEGKRILFSQKIKLRDLSKLARERSKKLGEPYTKSFAHYRKIFEQNKKNSREEN